jgi:uncharacterized membrane protein YeaQ/YmgE (transglycosylase-associated protein family)
LVVPPRAGRTDGWTAYLALPEAGFIHERSVEGRGEGFIDSVPHLHHTIGNLKAWLAGTHKGVSRHQLAAYLDEFVFRHNRRQNLAAAFQTLLGLGTTRDATTYETIAGAKNIPGVPYAMSQKQTGTRKRDGGPVHAGRHLGVASGPPEGASFEGRPGREPLGGKDHMGIISWIILGAIAGFLANMVVGGREGLIGTIILGIIGAVVGGYIAATVFHKGDVTGVNVESIGISVLGAILVLFVWRALTRSRAS